MNISFIIPNYNGAELLRKNLPNLVAAVADYKAGSIEIIIPDDGSTDNSKKVIARFISSINNDNITAKSIENHNRKEGGFSKNVNRAARVATGDILILLNSDVSVKKEFLTPLLRHFRDDDVFAVGCMDESKEHGKTVLRGRGLGEFKRGFLVHSRGEVNKNNTLWVSGGSGAFRKNIWDKLRGLDEAYNPFYWEDIDLSYRALKSGYQIVFEPESKVVHEHEEGVIKKKYKQKFIRKISYRNQFIFMWKNITDSKILLSHFLWLPYYFAKSVARGDFEFFSGFFEATLKLKQIRGSRELAKKMFIKKDTETIRSFRV